MPPTSAARRVRRRQGLGGGPRSRATPRWGGDAGGRRPAATGVPAGLAPRHRVGSSDQRCCRLPEAVTPSYLSSLLYRRKRLFSGAPEGLIAVGNTVPTGSGVARRPSATLPIFLRRQELCHTDHAHFSEGDWSPTNSLKAPRHLFLCPLVSGLRLKGLSLQKRCCREADGCAVRPAGRRFRDQADPLPGATAASARSS